MRPIDELLRHLSRPEVSEVGLATGRSPVAKVAGAYKPISGAALATPEIAAMLAELSPPAEGFAGKPAQWTVEVPGVGAVVIVAVQRADSIQARISLAAQVPAASPPSRPAAAPVLTPKPAVAAAPRAAPPTAPSRPAPTSAASTFVGMTPDSETVARREASSVFKYDSFADLLALARAENASDLHIVAGRSPSLRLVGELVPHGAVLSAQLVEKLVLPEVPPRLRAVLEAEGSCDFALEHSTYGRFRVNVGRQLTGLKASLRVIGREVPTLASLGLPESISRAVHHHQGLIIITGPTGQGKTSTLSALVDLINRETTHHVITVEDPIEYVHPRKRALMSQREVGSHTRSFQSALKGSLREDPDVIVVGELRDTETVRMALSAGETGHLLISTMNTPSAAKTIDRLIDLFPPAEQGQVRMSISVGLRLIVGQRLIPNADRTGVVAAAEVLPGSISLANLIREEKTFQIPSLQQRGKALGIVRFDDSLAALVHSGKTTLEIAKPYAESPTELVNAIKSLEAGPVVEAKPEPGAFSKLGSMMGRKGS